MNRELPPTARNTSFRSWFAGCVDTWDRFWFTPRLPHTLGFLRIVAGAFLLYSHLVLATDLQSFLGDTAWVNNDTARALHDGTFGPVDAARSYLWWISNPLLIWLHHGFAIAVSAALMVGLMTRITAPLAWLLQLMYLHRLTGALFGFDQIVTYAVMYLMIAPSGSIFSVDAILRRRWANRLARSRRLSWLLPAAVPTVSANIATRLFQLHLCVIYLFGGLAKARGISWWDGTAMWYSVANYEYQSIDLTWIGRYPRVFTAMSHATMFWEIFYCALIWPKLTRPIALTMAVAVHGGIALFLGMMTFGTMMIAANGIFVRPETVARWLDRRRQIESDTDRESPVQSVQVVETVSSSAHVHETPADRTQREAELSKRERELEEIRAKLRTRRKKLKEREAKYRQRVDRLKERESKIKDLVNRRRRRKENNDPSN